MEQIVLTLFILSSLISSTNTQQEYSGNSVLACNNIDQTKPSPAFLYTCNGQNSSCQAFLIFKSKPPYNSVPTISALTSSNPSELAKTNNVTGLSVFPTGKEVVVPLNCSCSSQYYQSNATYYVRTVEETYFTIANDTYQGLSTCDSLKRANPYSEYSLKPGLGLHVPIRCACPTQKQKTREGSKYLLTFSLDWGDSIPDIADRFNVSSKSILDANGFLEENPTLFPFTTILIPLPAQPSSSRTIVHGTKTVISPPPTTTAAAAAAVKDKGPNPKKLCVGFGIAGGSLLLLLIAISLTTLLWFHKKRRGRVSDHRPNTGDKNQKRATLKHLLVEIASMDQALREFKVEEIKKGTDYFSSKSRIKGAVFRGVLNGEVLAVKRTSRDNASREVNLLSKINHFNLINLRGVCRDRGCFYLVFDYMTNGSLKEWIRDNKSSSEAQSWTRRIQIALDVANGLHYLHSFTNPGYVHQDVTSSNILLDRDLRAKIANFRLARASAKGTTTSANNAAATTMVVAGTRGYLAPEYAETGLATPKVDVYAFGVVMLELITGKYAVILHEGREVQLSAAVASIMEGEYAGTEQLGCLVDPILVENGGMAYAMQVAKLSLNCLMKDPARRPNMAEVVSVLLKIQADLHDSVSFCVEEKGTSISSPSFEADEEDCGV